MREWVSIAILDRQGNVILGPSSSPLDAKGVWSYCFVNGTGRTLDAHHVRVDRLGARTLHPVQVHTITHGSTYTVTNHKDGMPKSPPSHPSWSEDFGEDRDD